MLALQQAAVLVPESRNVIRVPPELTRRVRRRKHHFIKPVRVAVHEVTSPQEACSDGKIRENDKDSAASSKQQSFRVSLLCMRYQAQLYPLVPGTYM